MQSLEALTKEITLLKAELAKKENELSENQEKISSQESIILNQKTELNSLHHQLLLMRQMKFGRKSEKFVDDKQGEIFEEIGMVLESEQTDEEVETNLETITYTRAKKNTKKRQELPKDLPSVTEVHDLSEAEKNVTVVAN